MIEKWENKMILNITLFLKLIINEKSKTKNSIFCLRIFLRLVWL